MTSFIVIAALGSIWYTEDSGQLPERTHVIMEMSKTLVSMLSTEDELSQENAVWSTHWDTQEGSKLPKETEHQ